MSQEGEILPPSPAIAPHPSSGGAAAASGGGGREYGAGAPGGGGHEYERGRGGGGGGGDDRPRDYIKDRPRDYGGRGPPPWQGGGGPQYGQGYHYQQHPPHMRQSMGPPGGYGGGRGHLMPPVRAYSHAQRAHAASTDAIFAPQHMRGPPHPGRGPPPMPPMPPHAMMGRGRGPPPPPYGRGMGGRRWD